MTVPLTHVQVPSFGEVDDVVLVQWHVGIGEPVDVGQALAHVAVDKADTELASPVAGTVRELLAKPYDTLRVGEPVLVVDEASSEPDVPTPRPATRTSETTSQPGVSAGDRTEVRPLSRIRRRTAHHMMAALSSSAQLTAAVEVDLTAVMQVRDRHGQAFRDRHGTGLSPLAMISRAATLALAHHPAVNARLDMEAGTATFHDYVNLGLAVDTERGLLVPNIKDAQNLTTAGMAQAISQLARRARDGTIAPDDVAGGTFTLTNTGSLGTMFGTPILTPPNVAILATYTAERRPVVVSDEKGESIAIRWMSYFCLTYDHQMLDGSDAAAFLDEIKRLVQNYDFASELSL